MCFASMDVGYVIWYTGTSRYKTYLYLLTYENLLYRGKYLHSTIYFILINLKCNFKFNVKGITN